jgi:hypothetical protein
MVEVIGKQWNGVCGSRCAVKSPLFQQVQVLSRQRSSRPGSYPSGCRGNEAVGAWETRGGVRPSASWQAVTCVALGDTVWKKGLPTSSPARIRCPNVSVPLPKQVFLISCCKMNQVCL